MLGKQCRRDVLGSHASELMLFLRSGAPTLQCPKEAIGQWFCQEIVHGKVAYLSSSG